MSEDMEPDVAAIAGRLSEAQRRVFEMFRDTPKMCTSSYLYDHYRRGLVGRMKPAADSPAYAAWLAGWVLKGSNDVQ